MRLHMSFLVLQRILFIFVRTIKNIFRKIFFDKSRPSALANLRFAGLCILMFSIKTKKTGFTLLLIRKITICRDRRPRRSVTHNFSAEMLFSLPICVIMGLMKASPFGRGGSVADGEGKWSQ